MHIFFFETYFMLVQVLLVCIRPNKYLLILDIFSVGVEAHRWRRTDVFKSDLVRRLSRSKKGIKCCRQIEGTPGCEERRVRSFSMRERDDDDDDVAHTSRERDSYKSILSRGFQWDV